MPNPIPPRQRELVKTRDFGRCFRCAGRGTQWHHRRSRSVLDAHTHAACNGVWLCRTCHDWVHAHPFEARGVGLIVSRHVADPGTVPAKAHFGWLLLSDNGKYTYHEEEEGDVPPP